ncbi:MAG: hypothetical protein ISS66_13290 [Desulfobacteraceae bacterium]|nr:hypothetical protein [Desulfobacteraceae bacterium]
MEIIEEFKELVGAENVFNDPVEEAPPDHRDNLDQLSCSLVQVVDSRHQDIVDGGWNHNAMDPFSYLEPTLSLLL